MLREDPDVIMVGEIRDSETADIAIRSAMTGHLVLSTLHTNTAIGAIVRLIDLGIEPFLISSSLVGVMAQRLVRKICPKCIREAPLGPEMKNKFGAYAAKMKSFAGAGCKNCRKTGYAGRTGVFELIPVNEEIKRLITQKAPEAKINEAVVAMKCHSMLEDGVEKIDKGITTAEEVAAAVEME
jgi:type IV pilus assembly protein PilB